MEFAISKRQRGKILGHHEQQANVCKHGPSRRRSYEFGEMAETLKQVLNMDDRETKRKLMGAIGQMSGLWEVSLKQRKLTRSFQANRYYFAAIVAPFCAWLREAYGDDQIDSVQAHEMLKVKILGCDELLIPGTNEVMKLIPRSKTLDSGEFAAYIDKAAAWLSEFCNIEVIPSEMFQDQPKPHKGKDELLEKRLKASIEIAKQNKRASQ